MTTAASTPITGQRTAATRQLWARVARTLLAAQLVVGAWLAATAAVVAVVVLAVVQQWVRPEMSAVQLGGQVAVWFCFGVSIMLATTYLRTLVAAGATRRSFWLAGVVTALVTGLVFALGFVALLLAERAAYRALGWAPLDPSTGEDVLAGGLWTPLWGMTLVVAVMVLAGLLVGATYLRWRGWATLMLPLTVALPFLLVSLTTESPRAGIMVGGADDLTSSALLEQLHGTPLGMAVTVLTLVLTAAGAWLALRDLPIRPAAG